MHGTPCRLLGVGRWVLAMCSRDSSLCMCGRSCLSLVRRAVTSSTLISLAGKASAWIIGVLHTHSAHGKLGLTRPPTPRLSTLHSREYTAYLPFFGGLLLRKGLVGPASGQCHPPPVPVSLFYPGPFLPPHLLEGA